MSEFRLDNLDKSDWPTYRFDEIAEHIRETVDPKTTELEVYIGLEHLDPASLHIRRYGERGDVSGGKLRCYPGDVIFGKRRAYQRKAAIVEVDAFCSAHSMVLRAKPDVIDPRLFPFFLHSDRFMHRAVDISVGSLSPTINWTALKKQKFQLPPKDQQVKLAELLWASETSAGKTQILNLSLASLLHASLNAKMISGLYTDAAPLLRTKCGLVDARIKVKTLGNCLASKPSYGANAASKKYSIGEPRYIRITDISEEGELIPSNLVSIDLDEHEEYLLKDGDFLFARTGNTVGKTLLYKEEMGPAVFAGYLIRFRPDPEILLPKFLFFFSKSLKYESFKKKMIKVGAQPNINSLEYQSMQIPLPSINGQKKIVGQLELIQRQLGATGMQLKSIEAVKKSLINQIF